MTFKRAARDVQEKCGDPILQNDLPDQDDAEECKRAGEDLDREIDQGQNDLPPP